MSRINRNESVTRQVELGTPAHTLSSFGTWSPGGPLRVQRRVSSRGVIQVAGQTLRVGYAHRHTLVEVALEAEFHVYDQAGEPLVVIPRTSSKEVTRTKGYGVRDKVG